MMLYIIGNNLRRVEMDKSESPVHRWIRRDAKKKSKRRFTSDNRKSVRDALRLIIKKAEALKD